MKAEKDLILSSLKITHVLTWHGDACVVLPLPHEEFYDRKAWQQEFEDVTQLYAPSGSTWVRKAAMNVAPCA